MAEKKTAGAFDIRNVIGALLALHGVILTLMGLFDDPETDKTSGVNANLWAGLALLVVDIGFRIGAGSSRSWWPRSRLSEARVRLHPWSGSGGVVGRCRCGLGRVAARRAGRSLVPRSRLAAARRQRVVRRGVRGLLTTSRERSK